MGRAIDPSIDQSILSAEPSERDASPKAVRSISASHKRPCDRSPRHAEGRVIDLHVTQKAVRSISASRRRPCDRARRVTEGRTIDLRVTQKAQAPHGILRGTANGRRTRRFCGPHGRHVRVAAALLMTHTPGHGRLCDVRLPRPGDHVSETICSSLISSSFSRGGRPAGPPFFFLLLPSSHARAVVWCGGVW